MRLDNWGFKITKPDFTTRHGFRWPFPGHWTESHKDTAGLHGDVCPTRRGDGLSVALTPLGARQGGYGIGAAALIVGWNDEHELARDEHKARVTEAFVLDVIDFGALIRGFGQGAYLRGAYLQGAYLRGAYLQRANLQSADLRGANLRGANLQGANLWGADLWGADLGGAYLRGADLGGANLQGANGDCACHGADVQINHEGAK